MFSHWKTESEGVVFGDKNSETTYFDMPYNDVVITAVYVDEFVAGDANASGGVDTADAIAVLQYIAGYTPPKFNEATAEADGMPGITTGDAIAILRFVAGY